MKKSAIITESTNMMHQLEEERRASDRIANAYELRSNDLVELLGSEKVGRISDEVFRVIEKAFYAGFARGCKYSESKTRRA